MPKTEKNWIVKVDTIAGRPIYLGTIDYDQNLRATRCGVTRTENALRFTRAGAQRVVRGWPEALAAGRAGIVELPC